MSTLELLLVLGALACLLALLAKALRLPAAILQLAGGLAIAFAPGHPEVALPPELVFVIFVPPIVYFAGFGSSLRDLRANAGTIASLAVGLVLATAAAIAVVAHALIPELSWAAAFVLGAIVAPTDIAAARAVLERLGLPRLLLTLLEGEGLLNDATAVITYRAAVAAVAVGAFSLDQVGLSIVLVGAGGLAYGVALGYVIARIRTPIEDAPIEITISLLTPYVVYLTAEAIGVSGIVATVATGIFLGRRSSTIMSPSTRIAGLAVWQLFIFVLNSALFMLIGLEFPRVALALGSEQPAARLVGLALAIGLGVMAVRMLWVFPITYLRAAVPWLHATKRPDWRYVFVVGWAGMRGMDSVTTALALPFMTQDGGPFPARSLIVFLGAAVVIITLVGQGLTLPLVMRVLGVAADDSEDAEEQQAREVTGDAALRRIGELEKEWPTHRPLIEQLRTQYEHRAEHRDRREADATAADQEETEHRAIRHQVLEAEREAAVDLRNRNAINDTVLRRLERDIDLEELRMDA